MIEIALNRTVSWDIVPSRVRQAGQGDISHGRQGKSADVRRADLAGGVGEVAARIKSRADIFSETPRKSTLLAPSLFPNPWRTR